MLTNRILISISFSAIICLAGAPGQENATTKKTQAKSSTSTKTTSRSRRVVGRSSPAKPVEASQPRDKPAASIKVDSTNPSLAPTAKTQKQTESVPPKAQEAADNKLQATSETKVNEQAADPKLTAVEAKSSGEPNAAITLIDQIDATPNGQTRNRLQLKLADQLLSAGKKADAMVQLRAVAGGDAFDPQGLYNAGNALARLDDSEGAINAYRKAIDQRKGTYSRAFNNLGVVLLREGRWDEAYNSFLSALKLEGFRYAEASYNMGRLYAARGETDRAVREWRRVLALDPEHADARQALAHAGSEERINVESLSSGNERSTMKATSNAVVAANSTPAKSVSHAKNTDKVKSVASRSEGASRPPAVDATSFAFLQKARTSFEHGSFQDSVDNYQRVLARMNGYFAPANLELSYALVSLQRNDEAIANLQMVANRDGARYPIAYYHLARLHEAKGNLRLAEEAFAQVAKAYGARNSQFLVDLSRVREKQGNVKGALEAMEEFVNSMQQQGRKLAWSDERLAALRQSASALPKN